MRSTSLRYTRWKGLGGGVCMATIDRLAPGVYAEPPLTVIAVAGVGLNVAAAAAAGAGCGGLRLAYACGVTSGCARLTARCAAAPYPAHPAADTFGD